MDFDWDEGNSDKSLFRHGVHDWEIEEAFESGRTASQQSRGHLEETYIHFGYARTSGKYLRITYTIRVRDGRELVRPISAVEMSWRQKRRYRQRSRYRQRRR